ncbi:Cytosolic Fe-S cluster assembly factor NUBP2 like protein, partial [Dictyocoela roeselum]
KEKGLVPIRVTDNLHVLSMAFMQKDGDCIAWRAPKKLNVCRMFIESFEQHLCGNIQTNEKYLDNGRCKPTNVHERTTDMHKIPAGVHKSSAEFYKSSDIEHKTPNAPENLSDLHKGPTYVHKNPNGHEISTDTYEYIIFDMPPGIGYEHEFVGNAEVILVTTSQNVALSDLDKMYSFLKEREMHVLGVIENMSGFRCERCGENMNLFSRNGGRLFAEEKGIPFLGSIEFDHNVALSIDNGDVGGNEELLGKLENILNFLL